MSGGEAYGETRPAPGDRAAGVDTAFTDYIRNWSGAGAGSAHSVVDQPPDADLLALIESQFCSRHLDLEARAMRARNEGFYTIGSAGHEGNAVLGRLLRSTDPAFLHYRSGGFMMERGRQVEGCDPVYDTALSLAASAEDPIAGGRHKVWGSAAGWVPPQTSTIASHLPKALGTAVAIAQAVKLRGHAPVPADSVVLASFGDASVNHAAAQATMNAAGWTAHQGLPCPLLLLCEDNGIGISVPTPAGWTRSTLESRPGIEYFAADGLDLADTWRAADEAIAFVRRHRRPACLHLSVVRLLGHAGSDVESEYRARAEIEADEAADPLLRSADLVLRRGLLTPTEIEALYDDVRERVHQAAASAATRPKLTSAEAVMAPLAPTSTAAVAAQASRRDYAAAREGVWGHGKDLPENQRPRHLAVQINRALRDLMAQYDGMTVFGEDVARKGGVYTVTSGLHRTFPPTRVFNTLLDETTILGMAQGQALMGLLPVPEIQYLAYYHNACDQLRGEAASLSFFSNGQFRNPMVIRIAGLAYQKGFGGHFHNDNSFAALRDIPGIVIACPARGDDAVGLLRTLAAMAQVDGRVCVFLEPIALYMTKDLYTLGDGGWLTRYPEPGTAIAPGEAGIYHAQADDLLIITYGNGLPMSLRAVERLRRETRRCARIVDLRWLQPLNRALIGRHADEIGRVLIVDEGRESGGLAEAIFAAINEQCGADIRCQRVCARDTYIPLGEATRYVLPDEDEVLAAAQSMLEAS